MRDKARHMTKIIFAFIIEIRQPVIEGKIINPRAEARTISEFWLVEYFILYSTDGKVNTKPYKLDKKIPKDAETKKIIARGIN